MTDALPPLLIETENFLLRPLTARDGQLDVFGNWMSDTDAATMINTQPQAWPADRVRAYLERLDQRHELAIGIFHRAEDGVSEGDLIGYYSLRIQWPHRVAVLEVLIGNPDWRGKDVLAEVGYPFIAFLFDKWELEKITAHIQPINKGMKWLLLQAGWQKEAFLRGHIARADGTGRADIELYSLLASDWRARNEQPAA